VIFSRVKVNLWSLKTAATASISVNLNSVCGMSLFFDSTVSCQLAMR
jgi:hypothetical protein